MRSCDLYGLRRMQQYFKVTSRHHLFIQLKSPTFCILFPMSHFERNDFTFMPLSDRINAIKFCCRKSWSLFFLKRLLAHLPKLNVIVSLVNAPTMPELATSCGQSRSVKQMTFTMVSLFVMLGLKLTPFWPFRWC